MRGHSIPDRNRTPSDFISVMPRFHLALGKIYPPQAISFFSRLTQKICFAKILREEERPAVKRVKVCLHTFTAKRLRRDELPPFYNLRPQSLPTVCNPTINPAFPRRGRGTALAVDEASFDSHPRSKTCRYARSNAGTRFIKVYKIYIIIVQINR